MKAGISGNGGLSFLNAIQNLAGLSAGVGDSGGDAELRSGEAIGGGTGVWRERGERIEVEAHHEHAEKADEEESQEPESGAFVGEGREGEGKGRGGGGGGERLGRRLGGGDEEGLEGGGGERGDDLGRD